MLNRRGGDADVVKVLDFGLVKAVDSKQQQLASAGNGLTGTPLYMSPEAIQSPMLVDACSDIYAVGGVAYFLLTGQPVFNAGSVVQLLEQHINQAPVPPSQRLGRNVSEELEHAVLACLEKNRSKRPQTARMLMQMLRQAPAFGQWTWEQSDGWWGRHERGVNPNVSSSMQAAPVPHERTMLGESEEGV
jgi:serine/threonine protein kinase